MTATTDRRRLLLAIASPYPPRRSAVAVYTSELRRALRAVAPEIAVAVWAIDQDRRPRRPAEVAGIIPVTDPSAYRRAAQRMHADGVDVAVLQYDRQAAGGPNGRYLLGLSSELARLGVPYLVTAHDVRISPRPGEADVLAALCRDAVGVVVLSGAARRALAASRIVGADRVTTVPFGPPADLAVPGGRLPAMLAEPPVPLFGRTVLSTVGWPRPGKGIEIAIAALPDLVRRWPDACYVVAGPSAADERYLSALRRCAAEHGVADAFLGSATGWSRSALIGLLRSTSVYLAPDLDDSRTASGSLAYAVAAGRPVVATAHPYAREVVSPAAGALVPPGDPAALGAAVSALLADPERRGAARQAAIGPNRPPTMPEAAERIAHLLRRSAARRPAPPYRVIGRTG